VPNKGIVDRRKNVKTYEELSKRIPMQDGVKSVNLMEREKR
jgi:hypothetical protein